MAGKKAAKGEENKNKKSGRTAQEDEDLERILAELGEGPPMSKAAPAPPDEAATEAEPTCLSEATDDKVESAAAKKKKKKKEKEKEKKAAAAAAATAEMEEENKEEVKKNDPKSKLADKKIPKHVREMQEALAKRKEAEERKKREEEERLRKEEEELRRQEELERQAEEARRRKKDKEKEKLLKKKQEAKRPIYTTKKSKPQHGQTNGAKTQSAEEQETQQQAAPVVDYLEAEKGEEVDNTTIDSEEKGETAEDIKENGDAEEEEDDDEEWDAKVWDDANLALPDKRAFEDEEANSGAQSMAKKEAKITAQSVHDTALPHPVVKPAAAAKKEVLSEPTKSKIDESKQMHSEVEPAGKSRSKDIEVRKERSTSGSQDKKAEGNLRSPICCIMGHVDTGKTKLLDCIRGTNVQEGEAGGITQQIGATYFPAENIRERTRELKADAKLNVPGLLVIDTPGHESFTNLRSRGSGLCDIAILVVDIMHGLEQQTIESLNLLRMRNTEFMVALNKVDRLYGWKSHRNEPIVKALKRQTKDVQNEFKMRLIQIITQFKEQGLNTELYYKNKEMGETHSIVPTSAISGEGVPDLLLLLVQWAQKTMIEKLTFSNEVQCTVLEVKVVEGHGTTIDVVLVNGILHEGDQVVVCGMQGPIVTTIRALLTPHPMKELRVKKPWDFYQGSVPLEMRSSLLTGLRPSGQLCLSFSDAAVGYEDMLASDWGTYLHHKEIKAAQGIKITAQGLEYAIAGTGLYVVGPDDDLEEIKRSAMEDMESVGTPICIPSQDFIDIGRIASIENNQKAVDIAKKGQQVAIKIVGSAPDEQQKLYGRHFDLDDELVSRISRKSIDVLKANYRDDLTIDDWSLVVKLKNLFTIQ
ncbi:hypothetical protein Cgig2_023302 [Carnegiea gigantea]|uniref:Tr-type G domain-containing protein n=1 Tax=Carnegiea gigantea TaxID=171969 RepID=A0A9Q1JNE3_9CARY|nr:hypothetical protein Cgig2_023302 [Carnegiea gigantea]